MNFFQEPAFDNRIKEEELYQVVSWNTFIPKTKNSDFIVSTKRDFLFSLFSKQ
jgi:hypothetical protein